MMNQKKNKVIAVVGATASGKTAYAVELARRVNGEIISADSRLVYKGLDIGTAKPDMDERFGIPHYMIDIVEPEVDYSVGLYANEARNIIEDIISRGKTPVIAGGTGLYFRILLENYDLPKINPDYELRETLSKLSFAELYEMLVNLDAEAAKLVVQNDKRRAIRFIEIVKLTGSPVSEARGLKEPEFEVEWIGLNYPREELYDRINRRVDLMIEQGLVDETKNLLAKHGRINNIINTIGYREITSYLDGELTLEEAKDKLKQNTRNYAKRQLTWFRKNPDIKWNCYPDRKKK
ncbi:TPA: tRNA (adenosine(37)-N6)-dimethylallyltransferase MiaA [Candidatus Gastranaerophilales bacterium HUM_20]|nr:tRNA dimethylallyltransferase [Clostridium sp. CAG:729]DAB19823.1 MAG TPA: tRNA (adenosine(37)-N6)-dimethylallyltransferase MiaA [Candidatus Gastranaerophilales bacterium HUM_20]